MAIPVLQQRQQLLMLKKKFENIVLIDDVSWEEEVVVEALR